MTACTINVWDHIATKDPYALYARLRTLGPVVRMTPESRNVIYAITRHDDLNTVTGNAHWFVNERAALNNSAADASLTNGLLLCTGAGENTESRAALAASLAPRSLCERRDWLEDLAETTVKDAHAADAFDAVRDLARPFITAAILGPAGFPPEDHDQLLRWTADAFDALAPRSHPATPRAIQRATELENYLGDPRRRTITPASWIAEILKPRGSRRHLHIPYECAYLLGLALTALRAATTLLHALAHDRDQLHHLRDHRHDAATLEAAVRETLRHDPPVQWSTRKASRTVRLHDVTIPRDSKLLLLHGSANRDPDAWGEDAHLFNIHRHTDPSTRKRRIHGAAPHPTAGATLLGLTLRALLSAVLNTGALLTPAAGQPQPARSTLLRGWNHLPLRLTDITLQPPQPQKTSAHHGSSGTEV